MKEWKPRGVVVFKLYDVALRASVSTLSSIQACLLLSSCAPSSLLVTKLSTCAEQVELSSLQAMVPWNHDIRPVTRKPAGEGPADVGGRTQRTGRG
jgi:hypothetical protein